MPGHDYSNDNSGGILIAFADVDEIQIVNPVIRSISAVPIDGGMQLFIDVENEGNDQFYQWQVQHPNGSWVDISGWIASTTFNYIGLVSGQKYTVRCIVSNATGGRMESDPFTFIFGD